MNVKTVTLAAFALLPLIASAETTKVRSINLDLTQDDSLATAEDEEIEEVAVANLKFFVLANETELKVEAYFRDSTFSENTYRDKFLKVTARGSFPGVIANDKVFVSYDINKLSEHEILIYVVGQKDGLGRQRGITEFKSNDIYIKVQQLRVEGGQNPTFDRYKVYVAEPKTDNGSHSLEFSKTLIGEF